MARTYPALSRRPITIGGGLKLVDLATPTLERLVPDNVGDDEVTGAVSLKLHLERYTFASQHIDKGRVLDIACGVGYGTRLIADCCSGVSCIVGVDICPETIAYARERYGLDRIDFQIADAMTFSDEERFDYVISLETIEHLPNPENFLRNVECYLRRGGRFVASVPVTPSVDSNPHHVHDFTKASFRKLLKSHGFREVDCLEQVQPYSPISVLLCREKRLQDIRTNLLSFYARQPNKLISRIRSTIIDGFKNRYLTIVAIRQ